MVASSAKKASAGGQELQPWLVNSSTTPSGLSAWDSACIFSDSLAWPAPATAEKASARAASHRDLREAMTIPIPAGDAGFVLIC
ncbi:hypothetical protein X742_28900 [Mesorhizobium sp. LNHC232B00]|nr:hypothetical protein X742_28900 [Mesorhizobium sp. LNHC232B00]